MTRRRASVQVRHARLAVDRAIRAAAWDALETGVRALYLAGGERVVRSVLDRPVMRRLVQRLVDLDREGSRRERDLARGYNLPRLRRP